MTVEVTIHTIIVEGVNRIVNPKVIQVMVMMKRDLMIGAQGMIDHIIVIDNP